MKSKKQNHTGLPIIAKVDIAVCGGSVAAVATAASAARAGASVFLGCAEPYLGEDVCATGQCLSLDIASTAGSPLLKRLFPKKADLPHGTPVAPARIKRILDEALLDADVTFRFLSYPEQLLFDDQNRVAGVVFATKSGWYAVEAKRVVDLTGLVDFPGEEECEEDEKMEDSEIVLTAYAVREGGDGPEVPVPGDERDKTPAHLVRATSRIKLADCAEITCVDAVLAADQALRASLWTKDTLWISDHCSVATADDADLIEGPFPLAEAIRTGEEAGKALAAEALAEPVRTGSPRPLSAMDPETRARLRVGCTDPRMLREAVGWTQDIPLPDFLENPEDTRKVDVLVVGGGTAGAPAAIAAARAGAKVLCIEPLGILGGTATAGAIANYWHGYREGFTAECTEAMNAIHGGWANDYYSNPIWKNEWMRAEIEKAGGEVWFGATATGAIVEGRQVVGAIVHTCWGCRCTSSSRSL